MEPANPGRSITDNRSGRCSWMPIALEYRRCEKAVIAGRVRGKHSVKTRVVEEDGVQSVYIALELVCVQVPKRVSPRHLTRTR